MMSRPRLKSIPPRIKPLGSKVGTAATPRIRGRRLMVENAIILTEQPLCALCQAKGKVAASMEIDHTVPLWAGGADDRTNKRGLCIACHRAKSAEEAKQRG